MTRCLSCSNDVPAGARFCPACGIALDTPTSAPTETSLSSEPAAVSQPSPAATRFLPGAVLAKRYRIISLLGRGGMGEVYRADDLKLGQPVALKFLPERVARDEARLARFLNEVKVALRVTHPNVCRVYDVGEVEAPSAGSGPSSTPQGRSEHGGLHYIAMEYVDGEDLASLLRRIGRLPKDKAVQIARQLCAGLAAAHEEGILHRDLKPANVMIDGRGRAKITDFGLASLAGAIHGEEARAGTPLYMAPEQLAGREVTARSDLYALGLVLYELFTGKRAFEAATPAEMLRLEQESHPTSPARHVEGMDSSVERAILRCLEREPGSRPSSALAVAASLPGGDPLAAALAAGETPSPEMVAAAGGEGGLRPAVAAALFGVFVVGLAIWGLASHRWPAVHGLFGYTAPEKPPLLLAQDAREILETIGHRDTPVDSAHGFGIDEEYLRYIDENDNSPHRWDRLVGGRPPVLTFFYRQSPRPLIPAFHGSSRVDYENPPIIVSGMANVQLDTAGRLLGLRIVAPQVDEEAGPSPQPDWAALFEAAGMEIEAFAPATPSWNPPDFSDARAAWEGTYPGFSDIPIRIEAAAYRGKPTHFQIVAPWTRPWRMERYRQDVGQKVGGYVLASLFVAILLGGVVLARRNVRLGRGDRKGATRLAGFLFIAHMLSWVFTASHVPELAEFFLVIVALAYSLFWAALAWLVYVALEPFLRRRWPNTLVSWNRLLAGRLRDPLVGRDILVGAALLPAALVLTEIPYRLAPGWLGVATPWGPLLELSKLVTLDHGGAIVANAISSAFVGLFFPILILFVLILLRVVLRKQWLAATALVVLFAVPNALGADPVLAPVVFLNEAIGIALMLFLLSRFGLLSLGAWIATAVLINMTPIPDLDSWYLGTSLVQYGVALGLAAYAFWISLAGRSLFGEGVVPQE